MGLHDLEIVRIAMNLDILEALKPDQVNGASRKFKLDVPLQVSESKAILKIELNPMDLQMLENDLCSNNSCNNDNDVIHDTGLLVKKLSLISNNFDAVKALINQYFYFEQMDHESWIYIDIEY